MFGLLFLLPQNNAQIMLTSDEEQDILRFLRFDVDKTELSKVVFDYAIYRTYKNNIDEYKIPIYNDRKIDLQGIPEGTFLEVLHMLYNERNKHSYISSKHQDFFFTDLETYNYIFKYRLTDDNNRYRPLFTQRQRMWQNVSNALTGWSEPIRNKSMKKAETIVRKIPGFRQVKFPEVEYVKELKNTEMTSGDAPALDKSTEIYNRMMARIFHNTDIDMIISTIETIQKKELHVFHTQDMTFLLTTRTFDDQIVDMWYADILSAMQMSKETKELLKTKEFNDNLDYVWIGYESGKPVGMLIVTKDEKIYPHGTVDRLVALNKVLIANPLQNVSLYSTMKDKKHQELLSHVNSAFKSRWRRFRPKFLGATLRPDDLQKFTGTKRGREDDDDDVTKRTKYEGSTSADPQPDEQQINYGESSSLSQEIPSDDENVPLGVPPFSLQNRGRSPSIRPRSPPSWTPSPSPGRQ